LNLTLEDIDKILSVDEGVCEVEMVDGGIKFV
jgi:hypothetical protein